MEVVGVVSPSLFRVSPTPSPTAIAPTTMRTATRIRTYLMSLGCGSLCCAYIHSIAWNSISRAYSYLLSSLHKSTSGGVHCFCPNLVMYTLTMLSMLQSLLADFQELVRVFSIYTRMLFCIEEATEYTRFASTRRLIVHRCSSMRHQDIPPA